jgi:hypothetical protein
MGTGRIKDYCTIYFQFMVILYVELFLFNPLTFVLENKSCLSVTCFVSFALCYVLITRFMFLLLVL